MAVLDTEYDGIWIDLYGKQKALIERRDELEAEMSDIAAQLAQLVKILKALRPLAGIAVGDDFANMRITDAIRSVLQDAAGRLSPTEVRDKLIEKGYDLNSLSAPMSSIYKILSRLADQNNPEITREKVDNSVFYRWGPQPDDGDTEITDDDIPF